MKISLLLAATIFISVSQPTINDRKPYLSAKEPPAGNLIAPVEKSLFFDLCSEIEQERVKACASACAASGKDYSFESSICGLGAKCKCI